jgi:hypothetical protein
MTALGGWGNFYVIVGSSAGALIGLQFVVMTLIANMRWPGGPSLWPPLGYRVPCFVDEDNA